MSSKYILSGLLLCLPLLTWAADPKIFTNDDLKKYTSQRQSDVSPQENAPPPAPPPVTTQKRQAVVQLYNQFNFGGDTSGAYDDEDLQRGCREFCFSKGKLNDYLERGWRVISSRHVESFKRPFMGNTSYCRCMGDEYVLEIEY